MQFKTQPEESLKDDTFYDFSANNLQGQDVRMGKFHEQVILIVNTASECGFTPQYAGLQVLYATYKDQGFTILGFPCNQFGGQEPGNSAEIEKGCLINYGVNFPMFEKIDVNGKKAHPIFRWLKRNKKGLLGSRIKWNFTKFLIDRNGHVVSRFGSMTKPEDLSEHINKIL